jgi:glucuronate isomerase
MSTHPPADPQARVLFDEMTRWRIFDPHSHIDPHSPAARGIEEILGYHYYTELTHSAGMPADLVAPGQPIQSMIASIAGRLAPIDNTVQHDWLREIVRTFHGVHEPLTASSIDILRERADHSSNGAGWDQQVWDLTNLEAVFLTNDFDDPLQGWDTDRYVPCLRTDDLVLKLHEPATVERLKRASEIDVGDERTFRMALGAIFNRFVNAGARACAISLPPGFSPRPAAPRRAATPIRRALHGLDLRDDEHDEIRCTVFWTLAELCADFGLPFDLMIGPNRNVYLAGVAGGRDLFDRRVSLHQYHELFNHFSRVVFPVSTLSPDASAELVAYAWIFPNVLPMGHWWYSNIPAYIRADLAARLQAVPKVKLVGYYSDAYKLEFILPKFNMYRRILAETLADDAIRARGMSETQALDLARQILLENPRRVFARPRPAPTHIAKST